MQAHNKHYIDGLCICQHVFCISHINLLGLVASQITEVKSDFIFLLKSATYDAMVQRHPIAIDRPQ